MGHQALRKRVARVVATGNATCARCRELIRPDEPWHLGHVDGDKRCFAGLQSTGDAIALQASLARGDECRGSGDRFSIRGRLKRDGTGPYVRIALQHHLLPVGDWGASTLRSIAPPRLKGSFRPNLQGSGPSSPRGSTVSQRAGVCNVQDTRKVVAGSRRKGEVMHARVAVTCVIASLALAASGCGWGGGGGSQKQIGSIDVTAGFGASGNGEGCAPNRSGVVNFRVKPLSLTGSDGIDTQQSGTGQLPMFSSEVSRDIEGVPTYGCQTGRSFSNLRKGTWLVEVDGSVNAGSCQATVRVGVPTKVTIWQGACLVQ